MMLLAHVADFTGYAKGVLMGVSATLFTLSILWLVFIAGRRSQ